MGNLLLNRSPHMSQKPCRRSGRSPALPYPPAKQKANFNQQYLVLNSFIHLSIAANALDIAIALSFARSV